MKYRIIVPILIIVIATLAFISPLIYRSALGASLSIPGLIDPKNIIIGESSSAAGESPVPTNLPQQPTPVPQPTQPVVAAPTTPTVTPEAPLVRPAPLANRSSESRLAPQPVPTASMNTLKTQINNYLAQQDGHFAVYYQDINTGNSFGINQNDTMIAASTVKVPVVLYLYNQAATGRIDLNEKVTYTDEDVESGAGTIYYNYNTGATFTLSDLANKALSISDNVAVNMLIRRLGMDNIDTFAQSLGADVVWNGQNVTSARSMGIYMQGILDLQKRSPLGQTMLDQMTNTEPMDRIAGDLPSGVNIAHKHGNNTGVINDVGIVFLSGRPYIVTLLSNDVDYNAAPAILAHVSRMIYDYQVSR